MVQAFLSYSRKDNNFSSRLRNDLINNGITVWRDQEDLILGENWDNGIKDALSGGKITYFLVALSKSSVISENVLDEISFAILKNIQIIPIFIEDCELPYRIHRRQAIDFRTDYDGAFKKLLEHLLKHKTQQRKPDSQINYLGRNKHPTQKQIDAAHDTRQQARLIAGPGTGKSFVIEERVRWLLGNGIEPASICVVSFTRASSRDLERRIIEYCDRRGQMNAREVSITTLHSLALKVLRKGGLLKSYPADPEVLDKWELEEIIDEEFSVSLSNGDLKYTPTRCKEIRSAYEALWSTGLENPPNYIQPKKPVTPEERAAFIALYYPTTWTYSCVLPGEIVLKCVERINSGLLNPVPLLGINHLIVDEFQDLNNTDLAFVYSLINGRVPTYVAGDDDQSIYSFRFAFPTGIQDFKIAYPQAGHHELHECFRCTPAVLNTAKTLIAAYPGTNRIEKSLSSHYEMTDSQINGVVHRWSFRGETREAAAIAKSCKKLIERGIEAREILILISSRGILNPLQNAFQKQNVDIALPDGERYIDSVYGRYAYSIIRIACDLNFQDYFAHRLVLGLPKGVSHKTCAIIRDKVIKNDLNYLALFYDPLPSQVFSAHELKAIERARTLCEQIKDWQSSDTLAERKEAVAQMLSEAFNDPSQGTFWLDYIGHLPEEMSLKDLRAYMGTYTDEQQAILLKSVYERLEMELPADGFFPPKVRVMTMHGAKGLDAQVVFIPGLEQNIFPGLKRKPYPGLVLEAARLLYVSITRARAACIVSFSTSRLVQGSRKYGSDWPHSDFNIHLQGRFYERDEALEDSEADIISQIVENIHDLG